MLPLLMLDVATPFDAPCFFRACAMPFSLTVLAMLLSHAALIDARCPLMLPLDADARCVPRVTR